MCDQFITQPFHGGDLLTSNADAGAAVPNRPELEGLTCSTLTLPVPDDAIILIFYTRVLMFSVINFHSSLFETIISML